MGIIKLKRFYKYMKTTTISMVAVIALLSLVAAGCVKEGSPEAGLPTQQQDAASGAEKRNANPDIQIREQDRAKVAAPAGFPSDIPIQQGAMVEQDIAIGSARIVHVIAVQEGSSLYTYYKDYFTKNGWTISSDIDPGGNDLFRQMKISKAGREVTLDIGWLPAGHVSRNNKLDFNYANRVSFTLY
jgi:hypothetical protein